MHYSLQGFHNNTMNIQARRNETRKLLSNSFNTTEGVLKFNVHNDFEHEDAKWLLCWELKKRGFKFVCEAIFLNGQRTDVLVLDDCTAVEVLYTETMEDFEKNKSSYPTEHVIAMKSLDVIERHENGQTIY